MTSRFRNDGFALKRKGKQKRAATSVSRPLKIVAGGFAVVAAAAGGRRGQVAAGFHDLLLDLLGDRGVRLEVLAGLFLALAELHVAVAEPGAGASDDLLLHAQVEDVAFVADAVGMH